MATNITEQIKELLAVVPPEGMPYVDVVAYANAHNLVGALRMLRSMEGRGRVSFRSVQGVNTLFVTE